MKQVSFFLLFLFGCADASQTALPLNAGSDVAPFGYYTNETSPDGEHSIGYDLALWSSDNELYGFVCYNQGAIGDDICNLLEKVKLNGRQIEIKFTLDDESFILKGEIGPAQIKGEISSHRQPRSEIVLEACCEDAEIYTSYPNLKAWSDRMREVLL